MNACYWKTVKEVLCYAKNASNRNPSGPSQPFHLMKLISMECQAGQYYSLTIQQFITTTYRHVSSVVRDKC